MSYYNHQQTLPSPPLFPPGGSASDDPPTLKIIQQNCAGSNDLFISLFSSFNSASPLAITAIQEPATSEGTPLSAPKYISFFPPNSSEYKTDVYIYLLNSLSSLIYFTPLFLNRGDVCGISFDFQGSFFQYFTSLTVY